MSDPEPVAAVSPTAAMPNAAAVAHASMHGTEPSDPTTRVTFLESSLETLGRMALLCNCSVWASFLAGWAVTLQAREIRCVILIPFAANNLWIDSQLNVSQKVRKRLPTVQKYSTMSLS